MTCLNLTNPNMKFLIIASLLVTSLIACKQKPPVENKNGVLQKSEFNTFLASHHTSAENYAKIIVIPGVGCTGCISEAQLEYHKNYKDTKTLYIFTAIGDLKLFKNTLPQDAQNFKNAVIDEQGTLLALGFKSVYPCELTLSQADTLSIKNL